MPTFLNMLSIVKYQTTKHANSQSKFTNVASVGRRPSPVFNKLWLCNSETKMSLLTYKYYDTPEGQDIFKKTFVTTKYAILSSLPVATFDVLLYSHPKGVFQTVMRYGTFLGPAISMATAFTLTTNIAQNVRGRYHILLISICNTSGS